MSVYSTFGSVRRPPLPQQGEGEAPAAVATISAAPKACIGGIVHAAVLPRFQSILAAPDSSAKGEGS